MPTFYINYQSQHVILGTESQFLVKLSKKQNTFKNSLLCDTPFRAL